MTEPNGPEHLSGHVGLSMYVVYASPRDYPGEFVARRFVLAEGQVLPRELVARGKTLAEVQAGLPGGLYSLGRQPGDDPCIVQTWI